jgi:sortase A
VSRTRWIAVLTAVGVVIAAAITAAAVTGGGHENIEDSPVLVPTTPVTLPTTSTHRTTTTLMKLPKPQDAPADPYAPTPIVQVGTIEIPKIALTHPVFEGITLTVIDHGPGHWPGSAMPCGAGNSVFPGHRVTHSHPFLDLDKMTVGDKIVLKTPSGEFTYEMTEQEIVKPTDVQVLNATPEPTITLIACHPKHSALQRIVVKGKLVASAPPGAVSG